MSEHTNDLIHETSPYLLQHAHNPVNWHAWNAENLEEAKKIGKPLLISVGYSSCHWCHVMEHESFEDTVVAKVMNENFYCIKVDREERPDVDQIYMSAANIITGSGGWPLNCFAFPDGRPFHAGTYYPNAQWLQLLDKVQKEFKENNAKLDDYATRLTKGIQLQETAISDNESKVLNPDITNLAIQGWKSQWDMEEGGTARVPKFPMPSNYEYLLNWNGFNTDSETDSFIHLSLKKMAFGGIFDQIGGGFSRYSTDAIWKAPHFEKMLYDNAQLMKVYAMAYAQTNNPLYLDVLDKTRTWLEREMLDKSGLFYAALDADSEGEEGKFYVWQEDELKEILGDNFDLAKVIYQINGKGLWEHQNNILLREHTDTQIAEMFKIPEQVVQEKLALINKTLLEKRAERVRPGLDDKCLTSWNGLMIEGLCASYKASGDVSFKNLAINCSNALLEHQLKSGSIKHSFKEGKSTIDGMLEDYAFGGIGLLSAFEITGNKTYYSSALRLLEEANALFYDSSKVMYYFNQQNELIIRTAEIYDNVIPSTNSAMAILLTKIGLLEGNPEFLNRAEELIGKIQDNMLNYPGGHAYWAVAQMMHTKPYFEIAIVGENADEVYENLRTQNIPNSLIVRSSKESDLPIFKSRFKSGETLIYVCKKGVCSAPVKTVKQAIELTKLE